MYREIYTKFKKVKTKEEGEKLHRDMIEYPQKHSIDDEDIYGMLLSNLLFCLTIRDILYLLEQAPLYRYN